jgi:DNA-binding transcriptional MerR regulator
VEEISIGEFARRSRLSLRALRLYDERGVLVPSRVDQDSGYRYYDTAQLEQARLVVMLRELQLPLTAIKELLACDPADAAKRIAEHWRDSEAAHDARRDLADYLVNRLSGMRSVMHEVATREMPERSLLCLKRNVDEQALWAFGKEYIAIFRERERERPRPKIEGREGASFCIYWGWPSADGEVPVEWCTPVPTAQAHALAGQYPELMLRTEPAHQEAFVALPTPMASGAQIQLAAESLQAWGQEQEQAHEGDHLALTLEDLGDRITYLATGPASVVCDLAIAFTAEP